ncbi:MAG: hypothetical protein KDD33_09400, partial [Bdellovibrionales bacterium]|nr:hypothetical protein [Bdellovibrionales bacterium]
LRDLRFMDTNPKSEDDPLRRITWLYPDDGCYYRAGLFVDKARELGFEAPSRVFVFGNLTVKTNNHPDGEVSWWYHTAPIVRLGSEVFVLDPAIQPQEPLPIADWILTQVPKLSEVSVSYCSGDTYGPHSACDPSQLLTSESVSRSLYFFQWEWDRQEDLGRDPEKVLGDEPPWLTPIKKN